MQEMMWVARSGGGRALSIAGWLGTTILARSWRLRLAAITRAARGYRGGNAHPRMAHVSRAWLREHEADRARHEDMS